MAILVDGVDECDEGQYGSTKRPKQDDQIDVLSVLLQAVKDPAFPFHVIVASRPETWIREFFANDAAGRFTEIFLDSKYSPDDDIRLYVKSKFADLCRRHGLKHPAWLTEEFITRLVRDASGQFVYITTIFRFIETPGTVLQTQLEHILKVGPQPGDSSPFTALDTLYTSIIGSSRNPSETVMWLKAQEVLTKASFKKTGWIEGAGNHSSLVVSAWVIDRLLESGGETPLLRGLPSLVYIPLQDPNTGQTDSLYYGGRHNISPALVPASGWNSGYSFYHKSFLEYLHDDARCGAAFPGIDNKKVEQWIWSRFAQILQRGSQALRSYHSSS
jgi:hypothetical protein